jgi:tetratricopeptide (TPR) repeat protein
MFFARSIFCMSTFLSSWSAAHAAPYIPSSDNQVLEKLPARADPAQQKLARLRSQLSRTPGSLPVASELARLYIEAARVDGDPRYLGYAQAVLHPWWSQPEPPKQVLVLRATIFQGTHQFQKALADLDAVLKSDRANGQAWLTRATVMTVLGEYDQARASCARLYRLAAELVTQACLANVGSLSGDAAKSYQALSRTLEKYPDTDPGLRIWTLTLLGEMAARLGPDSAAEKHFREAIALAPPDGYLLGAYSDFLLDRKRSGEVVRLLETKGRNDALLLRYALALKAQQSPLAAQQIEILRQRFAAAAMRGDTVHQREQSRFELHLLGDPKAALDTARRNWQVQKEPADLRVLVEAASAANDKVAMGLVREWMRKTRYEDKTLATQLEKAQGG